MVVLGLGAGLPGSTQAQTRPAPTVQPPNPETANRYTISEPPGFTRAVQKGTRTRTGRPGPEYWQQFARYRIEAQLHPARHRLVGEETITYVNRSPDTLRRVAVHLRQNLYAPDVARRESVPVTGGVSLQRVAANGQLLLRSAPDSVAGYHVDGTVAWLRLPTLLRPQDSVHLSLEWSHEVPPAPADGKEGRDNGVYFLGYWYPQVAVYDDVSGWVAEPYTGQAEFYMGQADYDVHLTVPRHWLVGATGTLQNPDEVLSARSRRRLRRARRTGQVVPILEAGERGTGAATTADGPTATWHFRAESVRDFAWGTSDQYLWDATSALVPPPSNRFSGDGSVRQPPSSARASSDADTVLIHSFFRPTEAAAAWSVGGARYTRNAVEALSRYLRPYPYSSMTAMEGVLRGGGMEYPMVTIMQPWADTLKLAGDLMHEVGHMWIPMEVGTNEKRYVWMDEGMTQFNTAQGMRMIYGPGPRPSGRANDSEPGQRRQYLEVARDGAEVPLMRHGDRIPYGVYYDLPYDKGAQVFAALRGVLGKQTFRRAYRTFVDRWWGKHPQPYDFFNTVADVTGRDLSWFWHTWLYTTGTLDQAITSVEAQEDSTTITVTNLGQAPMPAPIVVTRKDGTTERRRVSVEAWLNGHSRRTIQVPRTPPVVRVEIDPEEKYPDVDRSNQVWRR
ncbi:MAG: M1 family metallopeptidase [Salinibacter sp.]